MQRRRKQAVGYALIGTIAASAGTGLFGAEILAEVVFAVGMVIVQFISLLSTD